MSTPFQPAPQSQFQPHTATSPDDCVAAACAEAVARSTVGAVHTDHAAIRKASGVASGALSYAEAVAATLKVTGVRGEVRLRVPATEAKVVVAGGHGAIISIWAAVTHGTACGTNNFMLGHSLYINSYDPVHDTFHLDDPGTTATGFHDCPAALILRAAEVRTGNQGVDLIVWPDTEGVSWTARKVHSLRDQPSYTAGKAMGATKIGTTYPGGRTQNGEAYPLAGRTADGWVHVLAAGRWLWTIGDSFR